MAASAINWTILCTALVFLMQAGFLLLEAGATRSKHSINVAQKNLADVCLSVLVFFCIGFGLMFGTSLGGWLGTDGFLPQLASTEEASFFAFQAVFAGTAATIVSGSVAERMTFSSYLVTILVLTGCLYPVVGHWVWGQAVTDTNAAFLADLGFMDFAGASVVHSVGAWAALAAIILVGARTDRFETNGSARPMHGYSGVLSAAGILLIFLGWFGFNAGSAAWNDASLGRILSNTMLGGCAGGVCAMFLGRLRDGQYRPMSTINGIIAGLVGVTAAPHLFAAEAAILAGMLAAMVAILTEAALLHMARLDDVIGAISAHGASGVVGTLNVALLAPADMLALGSRWSQLGVQALGALTIFAFVFSGIWITLSLFRRVSPLRVTPEEERAGLNISEHGLSLGTGTFQDQLQTMMSGQSVDLSQRFDATSGDEAAEIATLLNPFLDKVETLVSVIKSNSDVLVKTSSELQEMSQDFEFLVHDTDQLSARIDEFGQEAASNLTRNLGGIASISAGFRDVADVSGSIAADLGGIREEVDQFLASVKDIAQRADDVSAQSTNAEKSVAIADDTMGELNRMATDIEDVVDLIRDIAFQTHMLSINASIEAARSGDDATHGFAVIAGEVRALARKTDEATHRIAARLDRIGTTSGEVKDLFHDVHKVVGQISLSMSTIQIAAKAQDKAVANIMDRMQKATSATDANVSSIETASAEAGRIHSATEAAVRQVHDSLKDTSRLRARAGDSASMGREVSQNAATLVGITEALAAGTQKFITRETHAPIVAEPEEPPASAPAGKSATAP